MFSQESVILSTGGHAWQEVGMYGGQGMHHGGGMHGGRWVYLVGGMYGRGHVWQRGAYMAGGMHGGGACVVGVWVWQCVPGACMAGGMHVRRGHVWQGVCIAGGHVWQGACMVGGVHDRGCVAGGIHGRGSVHGRGACMVGCVCGRGHAWQKKWPLQWMVCILLECILVFPNVSDGSRIPQKGCNNHRHSVTTYYLVKFL